MRRATTIIGVMCTDMLAYTANDKLIVKSVESNHRTRHKICVAKQCFGNGLVSTNTYKLYSTKGFRRHPNGSNYAEASTSFIIYSNEKQMARGGHHSVKMVTAVWPQTIMRVVIECLCMPHGCQQSVQGYDGRTLTVPSSPYIRFDWKKYMCEFSSKRRLLPSRWRGHVTVAYELSCHWATRKS